MCAELKKDLTITLKGEQIDKILENVFYTMKVIVSNLDASGMSGEEFQDELLDSIESSKHGLVKTTKDKAMQIDERFNPVIELMDDLDWECFIVKSEGQPVRGIILGEDDFVKEVVESGKVS